VKDEVTSGRRPAEAHRLLAERVASGEGFAGPRMRILLAETKFGAAEMLRQLLGTEGFEVVLASGPDSAGRSLDDLAVTLAVVDSDNAGFDDLLRELKHRGASVRMLKQPGP
jgi:PleD family two-component response regulator